MKRTLIFFASILLAHQSFEQQPGDPISPAIPTPNAASLGTFGDVPVSYFTGSPQIDVPLHSLSSDFFSLPVSLSLNTSGLRPDVHPSWVGNNWSLNAGGIISRTVKGVPDEYNESSPYPNEQIPHKGFYYTYNYLSSATWNTVATQQIAGGLGIDREPDIFSFNFLGYSGKFFLDHSGGWKVQSEKPMKVIFNASDFIPPFIASNYGSMHQHLTFSKFTLVDDKGVKYTFGTENAIEYSVPMGARLNDYHGGALATSWYLVKIEPPVGYAVDLEYERGPYQSSFSFFQHQQTCYGDMSGGNGFFNYFLSSHSFWDVGGSSSGIVGHILSPVYLKKITYPKQNCTITFITSKSNELKYPIVTNWPGFSASVATPYVDVLRTTSGVLPSEVIIPSNPNAAMINMTLGIPYFTANPSEATATPADFNTSKYIWLKLDRIEIAYANNNLASDYPGGLKIIRKKINFNYTENATSRLILNSVTSSAADNTNPQTYSFTYKPLGTDPYLAELTDHWGFSNSSPLYRNSGGGYSYISNPYTSREPFEYSCMRGSIDEMTFPTGGKVKFTFESHNYSSICKKDVGYAPGFLLNQSGTAGGLRIKKIENIDGVGNVTSKTFTYSSGILEGEPKYSFNYTLGTATMVVTSSSSIYPLSSTWSGRHISYSNVTETLQDGSYKTYVFSNRDNGYNDVGPVFTYQTGAMTFAPVNSTEFERGRLVQENTYTAGNKLVAKNVLTYTRIAFDAAHAVRRIVLDRTMCFSPGTQLQDFPCMAAIYDYCHFFRNDNIKSYTYDDNNIEMLVETNNYYDNSGYLTKTTRVGSDGLLDETRYTYPHTSPGTSTILDNMTTLNMLDFKITEDRYNNSVFKEGLRNNYANFSSPSFIALSSVDFRLPNLSYVTKVRYNNYDNKGNILEMQKQNDVLQSFIWGYDSKWPVAKIAGASYASAIALVNTTTVNSPGSNTAMQSQIDLVRGGLSSALIHSYLYSIYGEVISATDPSILTSKYDYDNIGRLEHVRDKDNNIVKKYAYAFQAQPYNQDVFYNEYIIANIARTDCASPCFTPTAVQFIQPGGKFTSLSSQSAAQTAAQNDLTTNNNTYAIANGSVCVPIAYSQLNNATNWIIPYSDFYPQAGVVTASMVIVPQVNNYGTWSTYILVGTLNCAAGKPTATRTVTATESGRTWQVEINTSGQVRIRLTAGTPPSGTPSMQLNFTYNL